MKPQKIAIFGPYKTGTTGLYYKIANSINYPLIKLFEPKNILPHKIDTNSWMLAKVILWYRESGPIVNYSDFLRFDKRIYLVRDPRDWVISGTLFTIQEDPTLYGNQPKLEQILSIIRDKEKNPSGISLKTILYKVLSLSDQNSFEEIIDWIPKHFKWLVKFQNMLGNHSLVYYEDFVDNHIKSLENYLGFSLTGKATVAPIHEHVPRSLSYENWRNWFTDEDIDFFRPLFKDYMMEYGYKDEWLLNKRQRIKPCEATEYIIRTVNKRLMKTP